MRYCLTSGCPPYSPSEPSERTTRCTGTTIENGVVAHAVPTARAARGTARRDRDLAVAGRLAVGDVAHGLERGARESADEAPVEREVELAALAGEVLVELRGRRRPPASVSSCSGTRAEAVRRRARVRRRAAPWTGWRVTMPSAVVTMRMSPIGDGWRRKREVPRRSCDHPGRGAPRAARRRARSCGRTRPQAAPGEERLIIAACRQYRETRLGCQGPRRRALSLARVWRAEGSAVVGDRRCRCPDIRGPRRSRARRARRRR